MYAFRLLSASCIAALSGCGARTGLYVLTDGGNAEIPQPLESSVHDDGSRLPAVDGALPPVIVMSPAPTPNLCTDAGATLIYVVTSGNMLMSFYPPTAAFAPIGKIACPVSSPGATPFSMAVDRAGIAYVVFDDGELFRVSTANAACKATSFVSPANFAPDFGMAYVKDSTGGGETLYVAEATLCPSPSRLAWIDTNTFALHVVGEVRPLLCNSELTGTGAGELFSFDALTRTADAAISRIDKAAARITARSVLPGVREGSAWAFAFWGGDFYTFTAPASTTVVTRFRASDGSINQVGQVTDRVVGAGVSTCAPQL